MRNQWMCGAVAVATLAGGAQAQHFNPTIDVLAAGKPIFGLYKPANQGGRRGGPPPADAPPPKTLAELVAVGNAYAPTDFLFDGSMEGNFDMAFTPFTEFMNAYSAAGAVAKTPSPHLHHPMIVKTHLIAENPTLAAERIGRQLNLGVSGIMFVGVESADEVKTGLAAMRFKSKGGTRSEDVGVAPQVWGMSEKDYKDKADLWPLNPKGEITNWTVVESKEGLAHVREIAAVKGITVLWPGAGTLGQVFSSTDANGKRTRDEVGWEAAIQQVLAACKEFKVPCGFPANTPDVMAMRRQQGFSVFVSSWGDNGFATVEAGRKASGR